MRTILLCLYGSCLGCGVSVHLSLISRITPHLPSNVTDRLQYARAGAFFPDAFYGCMGKSDAAEESHWPPFLAQGIDLVREKVQSGQTEDALNLYSFLYGVLSHQVADVTWHSLGFQQGLLDTMTKFEFSGDQDDAHSTLDVGGDFIFLHRLLASGADYSWIQESWDYSANDIIKLLGRLGHHVSKPQLSYCMSRGRAALSGELKVAEPAYIHYAQKSPLLYGNLEGYFAGGISEMHSQTLECMEEFGKWLQNPPSDPWDLCQVFDGKRPHRKQKRQTTLSRIGRGIHSAHTYFQIKKLGAPQFNSQAHLLEGTSLWGQFGKSVLWWKSKRHWVISSPQDGAVFLYDENLAFKFAIKGLRKLKGLFHARFGTGLEIIKVNDREFLAISSPGLSVIDFFDFDGYHVGGVSWKNAQVQFGATGTKLVGEALFFDNGILYVGAPYSDEDGCVQSGAVYLLDTDILAEALKKGNFPRIDIHPNKLDRQASNYANFGCRLARSNMSILVGSPGNDAVFGYDRLTHAPLLTLEGEQGSGFGGHLLAAQDSFIAIGAATGSASGSIGGSGTEQSGKVYIYGNTKQYILQGDSAYGRFGHSGVMIKQDLFIGSPFADQERGVLWRTNLGTNVYEKVQNGPEPFSGAFCEAIVSNSTHVICTAPFHGDMGAVAFIPVAPE